MVIESREENLALARRLFKAFDERDMDALFELVHPDVHAHPSIGGGPIIEGKEAVIAWWNSIGSGTSDVEARPLDFEVRGDFVIVRGYLRHREDRTLSESQVFWLYEIKGGLIKRMESHPTRERAIAACDI